jgi:hypothetical protein
LGSHFLHGRPQFVAVDEPQLWTSKAIDELVMPKTPQVRSLASLRMGERAAGSPVVVSWADVSP